MRVQTMPTVRVTTILAALAMSAAAWCQVVTPDRSTVAIARAEQILVPEGIRAPAILYPQGRVHYGVVTELLDRAVADALGIEDPDEAWRAVVSPGDRVGIQIDVDGMEAHDPTLDVLVRRIVAAGVPLRNIIIYAGQEAALFRAGFDLSGRSPGAAVMASDDLGYRGGISRIVLDKCTVVISLSRLRVERHFGMHGALANCLESVPYTERKRIEREPERLAEVAANSTLRRMIVLHVLDAMWPILSYPAGVRPEMWQYGGLMASTDPVALDVIGRRVLLEGLGREDPTRETLDPPVTWLEPATTRFRLGNSDPTVIDVVEHWPLDAERQAPTG